MAPRFSWALLLCALMAGAALADALPSSVDNRRALLARKRMLQVETTSFQSKCPDTGVDFRVFFDFDGDYDWFSKRVTDVIPGIFVDYFCDNIGVVNYQFAPPDNRMDDPEIQAKIQEGECFNEQVLLRAPGYQGRGPQDTLDLEYPKGKVDDMWVALNEESGDVVPKSIKKKEWRTADFSRRCKKDSRGCMQWYKVSAGKPVQFVCARKNKRN